MWGGGWGEGYVIVTLVFNRNSFTVAQGPINGDTRSFGVERDEAG